MVSCDSYDQSLSMNDEDSNDAADQTSSDDSRQILIESSYFGQPNETNNKISAIPRLKTNLYCMQMASREECAKQIYGRKIALDACLVGELKAPNWRQNSSGYAKISVPPCTFTTASGGSGMKMYPYSTQTSCEPS
ncbi:unnamed protein product [Protopolystoma xenopodis]|uniref:Uncharacterized protein n=1 Tax=Protopolystoma xenopodis TaxID=117903 RepID=A0A3S5BCV3_9PLAT|nr:unnamed protein product [Protopolystoma xenopodis]